MLKNALILTACSFGVFMFLFVSCSTGVPWFGVQERSFSLIANNDIDGVLIISDNKIPVKGKLNIELETSLSKFKRGEIDVTELGLIFHDVDQTEITQKDTAVSKGPIGINIPSLTNGLKMQFDPASGSFKANIPIEAHFPQLDEIYPPKISEDPIQKDYFLPQVQEGNLAFEIKLSMSMAETIKLLENTETKSLNTISIESFSNIEVKPFQKSEYDPLIRGYKVEADKISSRFEIADKASFETIKTLCIQPIGIGDGGPQSTGRGFNFAINGARTEWGKAGIVLNNLNMRFVPDSNLRVINSNIKEQMVLKSIDDQNCIEIFFVEKLTSGDYGGGFATVVGVESAKILTSDGIITEGRRMLLAHELGHVIGLYHPNEGPEDFRGSSNTVMCPCPNSDNPRRNSLHNITTVRHVLMSYTHVAKDASGAAHFRFDCNENQDCRECPSTS